MDEIDVAGLRGLSLDSRSIEPGWLYVALPGTTTHGALFIDQAVAQGAIAVLTDAEGKLLAKTASIPVIAVADPRAEMAELAAQLYHYPAQDLLMLGVTGTAGKTTTVALLAGGLASAGRKAGTIGTLGFFVDDQVIETRRTTVTTPESVDLQALLAKMLNAGADTVAMEVSSHALALQRVEPIQFQVAGFTNLGHDHLDYHVDREEYFLVKANLFTPERTRSAVINVDDHYGQRLAAMVRTHGEVKLVTVAINSPADYRIEVLGVDPAGRSKLLLTTPNGRFVFELGLIGDFSIQDALLAAAMLAEAGIDLAKALPGLGKVLIPGRMQRVDLGPDAPYVIVDFAHTPEAISAALAALPKVRRIAVFGCGGERDKAKRAPMGAAAAQAAALVIVTDDNPRSEDPLAIREQALSGARQEAVISGAEVIDGGFRRAAIRTALEQSQPGDWIAILGKGHEQGQILSDRTIPFDDVQVVIQEWADLRGLHG